jgi:hypothetical protein
MIEKIFLIVQMCAMCNDQVVSAHQGMAACITADAAYRERFPRGPIPKKPIKVRYAVDPRTKKPIYFWMKAGFPQVYCASEKKLKRTRGW